MDGDLCLEKNRCRIDEADATTIDSSIEAERDRSEGVADCVSGGIPNVAKTSEIASCEADRAGVEEEERSVESGLGFRSGCESGGSDFSERKEMARTVVESGGVVEDAKTSEVDSCEAYRAGLEEEERSVERGLGFRILEFSDRKEMAGTVVESGGVVEDAQVFERFSVLEGEKDLESAVEVLVNVGEVKMMDFCCLNGDVVHQDEVQQNVLDLSTNQSCDAKPEIVMSVDDSQSEGIKMVSCNNSSEIHGFSGGDGARKVGEDYEMVEVQAVDENLSNGDGCGGRASRVNVTESKFDGSAVVVKEGKDHVVNCPFTASGDGISAGSMRKDFAGLDKKGIVNSLVNSKQELNGKEKRAWRNGNGMNKASGMNGNGPFGLRKCSGSKRTYSRKEMEALRHVNVEEQRKTWNKIYLGLGDVVARLLDTMGMVKPRNHGRRNDYHQNFENQKHKGPILRMVATYGRDYLPTNHFAVRNLIQANWNS
ncbi:hypothetical protein Sjap_009495 [Stephania japonica]|uniref:Uncharacterized protein n=1 Tax=Stephania japonica TaxID=461633 RepID=A0AAP0JS36_9MAGN